MMSGQAHALIPLKVTLVHCVAKDGQVVIPEMPPQTGAKELQPMKDLTLEAATHGVERLLRDLEQIGSDGLSVMHSA